MPSKKLTPSPEVQGVIDRAEVTCVNGAYHLKITEQLERTLYVQVNKFLEALEGKWNRGAQAHIFPDDPRAALQEVAAGETLVVENLDFYATPADVAARLVDLIRIPITAEMTVLEPSAGEGALLAALHDRYPEVQKSQIVCVEMDPRRSVKLQDAGYVVHTQNFREFQPEVPVDVVLMNPPFSEKQDVTHVLHAVINCLRPGGVLVAVMSNGVTFRRDSLTEAFRGMYLDDAEVVPIGFGAFKESGTGVNTVLIRIEKRWHL